MTKYCEYCGMRLTELKTNNFQGMVVCRKCLEILDIQISLGLEPREQEAFSADLGVE